MTLSAVQRGVVRGMAGAAGIGIAALLAAAWFDPGHGLPERLRMLAVALVVPGLWSAAAIGHVARLRFLSPQSIDGGDADPAVAQGRAIAQNTLEQAVLAAIAYAALTIATDRSTFALAVLATCFTVGRIGFWTGYRRGAAARAFGFALTFYPTILALLTALVLAIRG
ncbi:MAPEG family protein [uncultured Sphingomonas sp.]|uniref:MAPEG family protein n=1 Tax=uncultured Sphingomonas sp. TaxID=158754 RepID=UPI0025DE3249|nr:MAPEG family protein [uncultured Sphingomonas sp.]